MRKNKKEYFIIDEKEQLVIYHSQERTVVAKFDEDKNTILPDYQFANLENSDIGKYALKLIYIKELNIEK